MIYMHQFSPSVKIFVEGSLLKSYNILLSRYTYWRPEIPNRMILMILHIMGVKIFHYSF